MNAEKVAEILYDTYYKDVVSDDFKNYGPGDCSNVFFLQHNETGKNYRIEVTETK